MEEGQDPRISVVSQSSSSDSESQESLYPVSLESPERGSQGSPDLTSQGSDLRSQGSLEEAQVTFSREEYVRFSNCPKKQLKDNGLALMPIKGLNDVSVTWPSEGKLQSENPYFLRGLAVTYFYQSQMSKARKLLLQVWKHVKDLDTALMLAECGCALPGEYDAEGVEYETFRSALRRVCDYVKNCQRITSKLIDEWNDRVKKSGRFMGYLVLQYAWYRKVRSCGEAENARHLTYAVVKKVAHHLLDVQDRLTSSRLCWAFDRVLQELENCLSDFDDCTSRKQAYVKALCCELRAWIALRTGQEYSAREITWQGLHILRSRYGPERKERILYGDLNLIRGVTQWRIGPLSDAVPNFNKALESYRNSARENITVETRLRLIELVQENINA